MNTISANDVERLQALFNSGVGIREAARLIGRDKNTVNSYARNPLRRVEAIVKSPHKGLMYSTGDICRYMKQSERIALWEQSRGPIPSEMKLAQTCNVPYCRKLDHMILARRLNCGWRNYRQWRTTFDSLKVGDYFEIPDVANNPREILKVRAGLIGMAGLSRIRVRSLPNGGVRVYKWGQWSSLWDGLEEWDLPGNPLILNTVRTRRGPTPRPPVFYLGFLFANIFDNVKIVRVPTCKVKACVMPTYKGAGDYCFQHNHFFDWNESMTWNGLDTSSIARPGMPLAWAARCSLAAEYPTSIASLERSLIVETENRGFHRMSDDRHKNAGAVLPGGSIVQRHGTRMHHRLGHKGSGTAKTRRGSHDTRNHGRGDDKDKRWSRETIETLEREADKILGLDSPEICQKADQMQATQYADLAVSGKKKHPRGSAFWHHYQKSIDLEKEWGHDSERARLAHEIESDANVYWGRMWDNPDAESA